MPHWQCSPNVEAPLAGTNACWGIWLQTLQSLSSQLLNIGQAAHKHNNALYMHHTAAGHSGLPPAWLRAACAGLGSTEILPANVVMLACLQARPTARLQC